MTTEERTPPVVDVGTDEEILARAVRWKVEGRNVALATVVATWGSAPRGVGSQMAISDRREIVGSVSGGCVEGAVVEEAVGLMEADGTQMLEYGVSDEEAWTVGLACGGRIQVWLESVHPDLLSRLLDERRAGRTAVLATSLATGSQALLLPFEDEAGPILPAGAGLTVDPQLARAASDAAARDASGTLEGPEGPVFLRVYAPPVRLVIVGAVHVAQHLVSMANAAGLDVVVVDPRRAFATRERFPGAELVHAWPDEALEELGLDRRTAVVTLTHDPKLDDPALIRALESPAFYVGALGSRRTHGRRRDRLKEAGVEPSALDRIHGPVGLPLGARTPGEIAISILAEVVGCLRRE
jgi:xanthine dehydrogenase accessory factor